MSTEEEAKRYNEALDNAKVIYKTIRKDLKPVIEQIFPELKESEDERTRKELIDFVKSHVAGFPQCEKYITWIEKQEQSKKTSIWKHWKNGICGNGEDKAIFLIKSGVTYSLSSCLSFECDYIELSELENLMLEEQDDFNSEYWRGYREGKQEVLDKYAKFEKQDEQKSIDPKFKIGDWVVFMNRHESIYQVEKIEDGYYILRHTHGGTFRVRTLHNEDLKLWTIEDAKDGDVLRLGYVIAIFKKYIGQEKCICYCSFCDNGEGFEIPIENGEDNVYGCTDTTPATKEQRDLLFAKIHEAGYEWDTEKKMLKHIPKFKAGNWIVFNGLTLYINEVEKGYYRTISKGGVSNSYDWNIDNAARLWTIEEARDGDVLSYITDEGDLWIMIYQSLYKSYENHVHYRALLVNDDFSDKGTCCIDINYLKPATREQRDLLFKRMKESGYMWDENIKRVIKYGE